MKHTYLILFLVIIVFPFTNLRASNADIVRIDSFLDFHDGQFIDFGSHNALQQLSDFIPVQLISGSLNGSFAGGSAGTLSDPGDGRGVLILNTSSKIASPVIINFDTPLLGLGASFDHVNSRGLDKPVKIEVYDGPDATGTLIESLLDSGLTEPSQKFNLDFIGVISDEPIIKSVLFTGTDLDRGFIIDGIAIIKGTASVPLPPAGILLTLGIAAVTFLRKTGII